MFIFYRYIFAMSIAGSTNYLFILIALTMISTSSVNSHIRCFWCAAKNIVLVSLKSSSETITDCDEYNLYVPARE